MRLEQALKTPAKIYYKYEGVSPAGSHKLNTSIAQAYFNKKEGVKHLFTETGAGQWGSALSMACNFFGLQSTVYMVRVSFNQKPYRKSVMRLFGAEVFASPSNRTEAGKKILKDDPDCPGSLGIAISEAIEDAVKNKGKYCLGSVLNHVILHQTIIGQEVKRQFELLGERPDVMIGCCGGGSNFTGFVVPYIEEVLRGGKPIEFIAAEPFSCPTLTKGVFEYDFGDTAQMTPLLKMYTLGHDFMPPAIHAGGLRYHGDSPIVSRLVKDGIVKARAYHQLEIFDAAVQFARAEGVIPAPESAHALRGGIDAAIQAREEKKKKNIVICLSGHGFLDMSAYEAFLDGKLQDYEYPSELVEQSLKKLPKVNV
jgi:tryptophan synthase beta chain